MKGVVTSVIVANEALERIRGGSPWVLRRDIVGRKPAYPSIVAVINRRREFVGHAFLSPESMYYLRIFSTEKNLQVDKKFWRERIKSAYAKRKALTAVTDAFRVVNAEADFVPSVVIDKYNDVWVIQITSTGAKTVEQDFIEIVRSEFRPASVIVRGAEACPGQYRRVAAERKIAYGPRQMTTIREGDQRFELDVLHGQKTGAYLDYRAFRLKTREFVRGCVLDAFCYQGWFSCQAAKHAEEVVGVDSSLPAIKAAMRNAKLNKHDNIIFLCDDVFEYLKNCGQKFGFIHLDPPSFAKGGRHLKAALRGYVKLVSAALNHLEEGGVIFVSSCSHQITLRLLEEAVTKGITRSGWRGEPVYRGVQDADHPVLRGLPESLYLKAVAFRCTSHGTP